MKHQLRFSIDLTGTVSLFNSNNIRANMCPGCIWMHGGFELISLSWQFSSVVSLSVCVL